MQAFQRQAFEQTLGTSTATQAQSRGYLRVHTLVGLFHSDIHIGYKNTTKSIVSGTWTSSSGLANASYALPAITHGQLAPSLADIQAHNNAAVEFNLTRYTFAGTMPAKAMGAIALTEYWRANQYTYPLLYKIVMDVLPVQASSVLSKLVFLSSKMTCTSKRHRISNNTMEAFQVLKHSSHQWRREVTKPRASDIVAHQFESLEIAN